MTRILALALFLPATAAAQTLTIDLDEKAIAAAGMDPAVIQQTVDGYLSQDLHIADIDAYMDQMAEAAVFSTRGIGVDYASNPKGLVFGISAGAAGAGLSKDLFRGEGALPPQGYAFQTSVMAGVNLGFLLPGDNTFLDRITVYGNVMHLRPPSDQPIRGGLTNAGLHAQLRLLKPARLVVFEFGGIALTTGVEQSAYSLRLDHELPLSREEAGVSLRWDGVGDYRLASNSFSIPLEASTNLRILFITLYGGARSTGLPRPAVWMRRWPAMCSRSWTAGMFGWETQGSRSPPRGAHCRDRLGCSEDCSWTSSR